MSVSTCIYMYKVSATKQVKDISMTWKVKILKKERKKTEVTKTLDYNIHSPQSTGRKITWLFYDNIVSQQMVFAIFFSIYLSSSIKLSNIALVFYYLCLLKFLTYCF